jgi:hypothetical protein
MTGMLPPLSPLISFADGHAVLAVAGGAAALALAAVAARAAWRAVARTLAKHKAEDILTLVAAAVATAVAMTGMWRFFGDKLHFTGAERVAMFAFLELAMVTEAFHARQNIRESAARAKTAAARGVEPDPVTAGADGVAVWVISVLSGIFASLDAGSAAAALFRLAAPLLAAWMWERGLSLYRRRLTGRRTIHWRYTFERLLVLAGLADTTGSTTSDVDATRRIARLARAVKRARTAPRWQARWARSRVDTHLARAVEHAQLATDPARQRALRQHLGALHGADTLIAYAPPAPWAEVAKSGGGGSPPRSPRKQTDDRQDDRQESGHGDRQMTAADRAKARAKAVRLLAANPAMPLADVVAKTGLSERTVSRIKSDMPTPIRAASK